MDPSPTPGACQTKYLDYIQPLSLIFYSLYIKVRSKSGTRFRIINRKRFIQIGQRIPKS